MSVADRKLQDDDDDDDDDDDEGDDDDDNNTNAFYSYGSHFCCHRSSFT